VIVYSLDGTACEKPQRLSRGHTSDEVGKTSSKRVEEKAFNGMVVKSSVRIWNIKTVVARVKSGYFAHVNGEEWWIWVGGAYCTTTCSCASRDARSIAKCLQSRCPG
jgi:hypothetical protein